MRTAFSNALVEAALTNNRVLLLTGDHGYALFDEFRQKCPSQYINAGVAEQNMVGVAAGLAKAGFKPIVYGLSAFVPIRVLEQIKMDVCYQNLPVIFIGDGAGLVYSTLGSSHQSFEDIASLRAIPHIEILSPCDATELTYSMSAALKSNTPTYIRMGKSDIGNIHESIFDLKQGSLIQVKSGDNPFSLIATGSMVKLACDLGTSINAPVWSAPWIKPIDTNQLNSLALRSKAFITLEEHSVSGGLGSVILENISELNPIPVLRIGIGEKFSKTCGTYNHLLFEHDLTFESIQKKIFQFISRWNN